MKTINVTVRDKIASAVGDIVYICGNSDYIINFDFDEEWGAYGVKTARFVHDGSYIDVVFTGNQCAMPVIHKAYGIYVGVYAGDLRTTTPAHIPSAASILSAEGTPAAPPEDVYAQITALCNEAVSEAKSVREDADAGKFDGAPGKTPVPGVDYFTPEDKQAIAAEAAQKVGFPQPTSADNGKYLGCEGGKAAWLPVEASGGGDISLGLSSASVGQTIKVKAVDENGKPTEWEAVDFPDSGVNVDQSGVYYVATNYGISTEAEDNTPALQALVDTVSEKGGGIIFFPVGTYNFKKAATKYAVLLKSNVSIMGENIETTILKQTEVAPYSMFYCMASATAPLTGCCFSNFTVDAYATGNSNAVYGKAFFIQYLRDCVFRGIRLLGTIATAMGIDYLDRVAIDNINCVDCGRTYTGGQSGTSGIGIGTGGWEEENFTISNCICVGSGQFGIFIENQHVLGWGGNVNYSKGCIIANCIVRGGLNHGIGIRGGENVTVIGCETYENAKHGIYMDNKCKNVKIINCSSTANRGNGVNIKPNAESSRIVVKGCVFVENTAEGIRVETASDKICISDNHTDENSVGLYIGALTLNDCVLNNNTIMDGTDISASFTGNADYNDFSNVEIVAPTAITADPVSVYVGKIKTVQYSLTPANASKSVTFESSNGGIATIDTDGRVTGIAEGNCEITIRSAIDTNVYATVNCTVSEQTPGSGGTETNGPVTVLNGDLTSGYSLDANGAEIAKEGTGVSDYIDISDKFTSSVVFIAGKNFDPFSGAALCEYDSNKAFLARTSLYNNNVSGVQGSYAKEYTLNVNTQYIRIAVNNVTSTNSGAKIVVTEEYSTFTTSNLTADSKLLSDGTTTTERGHYLSEIVSVPDGATHMYAYGYADKGRLCVFDENQNVIESFGNYSTKPMNGISYDMTGVKYIRFSTNGSPETIYLIWLF